MEYWVDILSIISDWWWTVILGFTGWMGKVLWQKNEDMAKLSTNMSVMDKRISTLENDQLKHEDVRIVVEDVLKGYIEDQKEIKTDVKSMAELLTQIRVDLGVINSRMK